MDPKCLDVFKADGNVLLSEYDIEPAGGDADDEKEAADSGNLPQTPNLNELYMVSAQ